MKFAFKLIKKFDSYGKVVQLNLNGKETTNSFCGGLFSLINLLFFIVILLINFYQFIFIPTPLITASEIFRPKSEMETISSENFMISNFFFTNLPPSPPTPIVITPEFSSGFHINLKMEKAKVNVKQINFGNFTDCTGNKLYMENKNFKSIYQKINSLSNLNFVTCFNFNENNNFTAGGDLITYTEMNRIMIDTEYNLCDFVSKENNCTLTKQDFNFLSQIKIMTLVKNNYVDKDIKQGYNEIFETSSFEVDFTKDLVIKLKAKRVDITTDNNLLYNLIPNVDTDMIMYDFDATAVKKNKLPKFVLSYEVELDSYKTFYERSYLKLDGLLANVGSIVVMIEFLTKFLADFFTEGNMEHSIYKEVFHIKKAKFLDIDPKIFSGIHKFKNINKQFNQGIFKNEKRNEVELQEIRKESPDKDELNSKSLSILNAENQDASAIAGNTFRNENELKQLRIEYNDKAGAASAFKSNNEKDLNKIQDKKVYEEFRKILKEKTVKKSIFVRSYQVFMPCLIKKNKNLRLLINLQDFISEELDIIKIIKKLIEYEHFKDLFLTDNQMKIFNLMQKRILTEEILEEDASDYYTEFYFKNKMKELKTFKHLVDHLSNVDEENQYSKPILEKLISSFSF